MKAEVCDALCTLKDALCAEIEVQPNVGRVGTTKRPSAIGASGYRNAYGKIVILAELLRDHAPV